MSAESNEHSLLEVTNFGSLDGIESMDDASPLVPVTMEQKRSIECHAFVTFMNQADMVNDAIDSYRDDNSGQFAKLSNLNEEVRKAKITFDSARKSAKNTRTFTLEQVQNPAFREELIRKDELNSRREQAETKYNEVKGRRDSFQNSLYAPLDDLRFQLNNLLTGCAVQGLTIAKLLNVPSFYTDRDDWDNYVRFYVQDSYVFDEPVTAFHVLYGGTDDDGNPLADGNEHGHISIDINTGVYLYDRSPNEEHGRDNFGPRKELDIRKLKQAIVAVMENESWEDDNESVLESIQSRLQFLPPALRELYKEGYRLKLESPVNSQSIVA